jgi:hypothetical protein
MPRLKIICAGCLHPIRKAAVDHLGGMALLCDKCKEDRISEIARLMRKHGAESHEPRIGIDKQGIASICFSSVP